MVQFWGITDLTAEDGLGEIIMYKAIHAQTGEEIVILHPAWRKRIDRLRDMDREDLLLCQGCRQALRVKAGEVYRPHFAHKHLKACSYGKESAEILFARAVLYEWLLPLFGDMVTVEKNIPGFDLPRPVDCWVEKSTGPIAYWIIEAGIKLEARESIKAVFENSRVGINYVFLSAMLHEEKKEYHSLLLTPTERTFLKYTPFDDLFSDFGEQGSSISYLDAEKRSLITYRGLKLFHRPNWFKGMKKDEPLSSIRPDMTDGKFIYPGESAKLQGLREKKLRLSEKRKAYEERVNSKEQKHIVLPREGWGISARAADLHDLMDHKAVDEKQVEKEELPCATCGQITNDYWATFYDPSGRKLCRCRECLARETG